MSGATPRSVYYCEIKAEGGGFRYEVGKDVGDNWKALRLKMPVGVHNEWCKAHAAQPGVFGDPYHWGCGWWVIAAKEGKRDTLNNIHSLSSVIFNSHDEFLEVIFAFHRRWLELINDKLEAYAKVEKAMDPLSPDRFSSREEWIERLRV